MNKALREAVLTDAFHDVENLLYKTCHKFWKEHGGDLEELQGEAREIFMEAYESWDKERSCFLTWVGKMVWYGLISRLGKRAKKHNKHPEVSLGGAETLEAGTGTGFDLNEFLDELKWDARAVVELVLDPPLALRAEMQDGKKYQTDPLWKRFALRQYLKSEGWSDKRISDVFLRIQGALE
jgi:hypothetical protein